MNEFLLFITSQCCLNYYESRKRVRGETGIRLFIINRDRENYSQNLWMSRCDERLKARVEVFILLWIEKARAKVAPRKPLEMKVTLFQVCFFAKGEIRTLLEAIFFLLLFRTLIVLGKVRMIIPRTKHAFDQAIEGKRECLHSPRTLNPGPWRTVAHGPGSIGLRNTQKMFKPGSRSRSRTPTGKLVGSSLFCRPLPGSQICCIIFARGWGEAKTCRLQFVYCYRAWKNSFHTMCFMTGDACANSQVSRRCFIGGEPDFYFSPGIRDGHSACHAAVA